MANKKEVYKPKPITEGRRNLGMEQRIDIREQINKHKKGKNLNEQI